MFVLFGTVRWESSNPSWDVRVAKCFDCNHAVLCTSVRYVLPSHCQDLKSPLYVGGNKCVRCSFILKSVPTSQFNKDKLSDYWANTVNNEKMLKCTTWNHLQREMYICHSDVKVTYLTTEAHLYFFCASSMWHVKSVKTVYAGISWDGAALLHTVFYKHGRSSGVLYTGTRHMSHTIKQYLRLNVLSCHALVHVFTVGTCTLFWCIM